MSRAFLLTCFMAGSLLLQTPSYAARQTLEEILVVVNNEAITRTDFNQYKNTTLRQLQRSNTPLPPAAQLDAQILDRLINERIQLQVAEQTGLQIEEAHLNRSIERIAEDSHMTTAQFLMGLERSGVSVNRFKDDIRHEILLNRLQEREIGARVNITDADIEKFWDEQDKLPNQNATALVPQYRARHILIKVSEAMPDADAKQKINDLYRQLRINGAAFSALAEQHSEDGTARKGGDLSWIGLGDTVPEFEHAMLALKPNQISQPVRTPFGYHLIQLLETRQYDPKKNRDKTIARNALRAQRMQETFAEWLQQLRAKATVEYRAAKAPGDSSLSTSAE